MNDNASSEVSFNAIIELVRDSYNEQLQVCNAAENEALTRFKHHYRDILDSGSKSNIKSLNNKNKETFHNDYAFKPVGDSGSRANDIDSLYDRCFDLISRQEQKELCLKKVTVPEPFNLTCYRDKPRNVKTNQETENISEHKHPKPVPAYVYLPLYEIMKSNGQTERRDRLEQRQKKLLATVKPFELSTNLEVFKPRRHSCSSTDIHDIFKNNNDSSEKAKVIKANPFPKHLFDIRNKHVQEVEEQLRQIRIKARAEEMLKQSSLPFTGDKITRKWNSMGSLGQEKKKDKQKSSSYECQNKYFLYIRRNQSSVNKQQVFCKETTIDTKPVEIVGKSIAYSKQSKKKCILDYERLCQSSHKQEKQTVKQLKEFPSIMRNKISLKIRLNEHLMNKNKTDIKSKLKENRENDLQRIKEYTREISEMKERVSRRPLLIEQQAMDSIRKSVQRKLAKGEKYQTIHLSRTNSISENSSQSANDPPSGEAEELLSQNFQA